MKLTAFDVESHMIQPGLPSPPMVCASTATEAPGDERLLTKAEGLAKFRELVSDPGVLLGGQQLDYDFGVVSAEEPSLVPLIFRLLEEGRAVDSKLLEKLHTVGTQGSEALDRGDFSLAALETKYLGIDRSAEKENGWRLSYALLEHVPISEWPVEAVQYPRADARGTLEVLRRQLDVTTPRQHEGMGREGAEQACFYCDGTDPSKPCTPAPRVNLQCIVAEMRAAWFLKLSSLWGMRTDPVMVPEVIAEIVQRHEESRRKFFKVGIVRVRPCTKKAGEYERADDISAEWLADAEASLTGRDHEGAWVEERRADITTCHKALVKGRPIRFAEDKGRLKELVTAAYKGDPPLTAGGESGNQQVSTSRDTLSESGDELLEEYGEAGANEKLLSTYVDVLTQGTTRPICPDANSFVATQRTSYRRPNLQQLPRAGRIRYCFVPRGYEVAE